MIKNVTIKNSYGYSIELHLDSPQTTGYAITGIDGLDPPQVDIKQTQMVSGLKYRYNFGFHKYREITINIIYYEDNVSGKNVDTLRNELMSLVKTNDEVILDFGKTERVTSGGSTTMVENHYFINGWVSQHSPTIFAAQTGCVIKVTCPDPWFKKKVGGKGYGELQFSTQVTGNYPSQEQPALLNNFKYSGNITTGFLIDTRTTSSPNPSNWHENSTIFNNKLYIKSYFIKSGSVNSLNEQILILNPIKCPDDTIRWYLTIDTINDNLKIYVTSENGDVVDCIGSIDSMDIINRKELPHLNPCSENEQYVDFGDITNNDEYHTLRYLIIYYNELYRGL